MKKIPENVMMVLKAVLPLVVVAILFVVVGQFGFGKISEVRDQIGSAQNDQKILSQKLEVLRNVAATGAQSSNLAVMALPDSNSSLSVIAQIKVLAGREGLTISEIKSGSPAVGTKGLSAVSISFNVAGTRAQIESFITGIGTIAPISIVDKIKMSESTPGTTLASLNIKSFWAPFPTKIPAVTTALTDLTPAEQQILQGLGGLIQPVFSQVVANQGGKTDPFAP